MTADRYERRRQWRRWEHKVEGAGGGGGVLGLEMAPTAILMAVKPKRAQRLRKRVVPMMKLYY